MTKLSKYLFDDVFELWADVSSPGEQMACILAVADRKCLATLWFGDLAEAVNAFKTLPRKLPIAI